MRGDARLSPQPLYVSRNEDLRGIPVLNPCGTRFGVLDGAVISAGCGAVSYFVVSRTRLFGLRRSRQLLPASALTMDAEKGAFVVTPLDEEVPLDEKVPGSEPDAQSPSLVAPIAVAPPVMAPPVIAPSIMAPSLVEVATLTLAPVAAVSCRAEVPAPPTPVSPTMVRLDPARG